MPVGYLATHLGHDYTCTHYIQVHMSQCCSRLAGYQVQCMGYTCTYSINVYNMYMYIHVCVCVCVLCVCTGGGMCTCMYTLCKRASPMLSSRDGESRHLAAIVIPEDENIHVEERNEN